MLEYLFNFIKTNKELITFLALGLTAASIFSKKIKIIFLGALGCVGIFSLLVVFHRLGLGLDKVYFALKGAIIFLCEWLEYSKMLLLSSGFIRGLFQFGSLTSLNDVIYNLLWIFFLILGAELFLDFKNASFRCTYIKKISFKIKYIIKKVFFINTIKERQPKFVLNSCFRC